jgi:hypothetical protein
VVPEEQDVDTDHDAYKRKDVDHNSYVSSHAPSLSGDHLWRKCH